MPTDPDISEEAIAGRFHETYEMLAPRFGYRTNRATAVVWESVPEDNRQLMIETVRVVVSPLIRALRAALTEAEDGWEAANADTEAFSACIDDLEAENAALREDRYRWFLLCAAIVDATDDQCTRGYCVLDDSDCIEAASAAREAIREAIDAARKENP